MCRVFVSGRGNVYMREIAEHLVEALALGGRQSELVVDELPTSTGDPLQNLVVAPHEFFVLSDATEAEGLRAAETAVCVNTEQPGTPWFDLAMTYASRGPVVLDINRHSLEAIRRRGIPVVHLPLGCTPSMDAWGGAPRPRPVDLAFHGGRTPRREAFVGGAGGVLWEWNTDVRFFSWHQPVVDGDRSFLAGAEKYTALAGTRILLNVHRGDEPYFEWARVVEAIANGCVVASETSVGFEPLVPGGHFLMAPFEHLAEQAVALAFDEPRRAAMAEAAYKLTTSELSQDELLQAALNEAAKVARVGGRRQEPKPARRARPRQHAEPTQDELDKAIKEANEAYLAQVENTRAIEATLCLLEHGDPAHVETTSTAAWQNFVPEVSVVVTVNERDRQLRDTVKSVIAATSGDAPRAEVVVVDDRSGDHTPGESPLAAIDWFPATFVARSARSGIDAARATGVDSARAPFVLLLRAGDTIYPNALRRLIDCLQAAPDDVVAAYGSLEVFDAVGSVGLTNHLDWDVGLLVKESYLDGTALYRRQALQELEERPAMVGWEDYDQWLAIAERGWRAEQIHSVVGRRRQLDRADQRIVAADIASTFVIARQRHPRLPWPS